LNFAIDDFASSGDMKLGNSLLRIYQGEIYFSLPDVGRKTRTGNMIEIQRFSRVRKLAKNASQKHIKPN